MSTNLEPDKALIFRIVHRDNVPWILEHGMHCRTSPTQAPTFRTIGNSDLIDKRQRREVPIPPGGTLSDYVPFYFTPYSPMMLNITTGYGGVTKVPNEEIVIFVSSLPRLTELARPFVFTDRHAYLQAANFYSDYGELDRVDWALLRSRNFAHDPDDPEKGARYQAEALVHGHVPLEAFLGLVCYSDEMKDVLDQMVGDRGLNLQVFKRTRWYF